MQTWRKDPRKLADASLWLKEAMAAEPGFEPRVLKGDTRADVCMVGGGFSALWTAWRLKEQSPTLAIVIVEAGLCGHGASGRNSGGTGHWWAKLPTLVKLLGKHDAKHLIDASVDILQDVRDFIGHNGIDCDLRVEKSVWSTTFPKQPGAWLPMFKAAEAAGFTPPHRELSADEMRDLFGSAPFYSGIVEDQAIRVQPARLARALRQLLVDRGVRIYETSPVTRVASEKDNVAVFTEQGTVRAGKVLLAANAWMSHLPEFKPYIAVTSSEIVVTEPIPEILAQRNLRKRPGGVNSRMMLNYGGLTSNGRAYLGRGGGSIAWANHIGPEFDRSERMLKEVEADFRYLYPELNDVPIAAGWSGPIDRSPTGLPWFASLAGDPRVHYAIGYSGHGMGATALGGRIMASQLLGKDDDWSQLGKLFSRARKGWYPPEPIRYAAAVSIRNAVARKEAALREGRAPSKLDNRLASYAMSSLPDTLRRGKI
ncbi:NAD(P)/FAD-dependent oxidoreductase [Ramlibacter sp.]|uniref:NAD(P)/FAD-dependent oxidoreductase n=1 Tax=Ramlibacter sp. TaxID=1917967 RepID=UPI003D0B7A18